MFFLGVQVFQLREKLAEAEANGVSCKTEIAIENWRLFNLKSAGHNVNYIPVWGCWETIRNVHSMKVFSNLKTA